MTVRIENWSIAFHPGDGDGYTPPECLPPRLHGFVYGYPNKPDGHEVTTSIIKNYDFTTNEVVCFSRKYVLGKVDPNYEEKYPNALQRFLDSFKK